MRTIFHDLKDSELKKIKFRQDDKLISALECNKYCIGCFSCWIKTPTKCVFKDVASNNVEYLKNSDELIIISKSRYGCYSSSVKRLLERSIGYVLPYFTVRNKEIHHQSRYDDKLKLTTYFYGDINDVEKEALNKLVKANAMNLETNSYEVICTKNVKELEKCIH